MEGERWRGGGEVTEGHSAMWAFLSIKRSHGQHDCEINLKEALRGGSARGREGGERGAQQEKGRGEALPLQRALQSFL